MLIDQELSELAFQENDEVIQVEEDSFETKIARLVLRQVPDSTICQIYQISKSELSTMMDSEDFIEAAQRAGEELHSVPVEIDVTWDDVERTSLKKLQTSLKTGYLTNDELLRTASAANRATRKGDSKKNEGNQDAGTNRITIEFSQNFINIANSINVEERNKELADIGKNTKMVDYMPPKEFEKFIDDKVPEVDEMTIFEKLDEMRLTLDE